MVEKMVYIPDAEAAIEFVRCLQRSYYEADLEDDNIRIDAKSILGVLAEGIGKKLKLKIYNASSAEEIDELLKKIYIYSSDSNHFQNTKYSVRCCNISASTLDFEGKRVSADTPNRSISRQGVS